MLSGDLISNLKSFVICNDYGDTQSTSLNEAHAVKWKILKINL